MIQSSMDVEIAHQVDGAAWDAAIAMATGASVFQTSRWAAYQQAYLGATPRYLVVRDGASILARLMILESARGQESLQAGRAGKAARWIAPLLHVCGWREGPLLDSSDRGRAAFQECLAAVDALCRRLDVTGIDEVFLPLMSARSADQSSGFLQAGYSAEKRATIKIDLGPDLDVLWSNLKKDVARTRVRKAEKQGIVVREALTLEEVGCFHRVVSVWRDENGFPPYVFDRYGQMFTHLSGYCSFFVAERSGEPLAAAGLLHFNGQATVFTPVMIRAARARRLYAGDLLYWSLIRCCRERGYSSLDLAGIAVRPASAKDAGIMQFKKKWGGGIVEYPVFTKVFKRVRWGAANSLRTAARTLRSLKAGT